MARWEPDAQLRLMRAALELFIEQGYDNTTVTQIAVRAGLTKSTFFRHFPDKREGLFFGQDALGRLLADGVATAHSSATPLQAVATALDAAGAVAFTPDRREFACQRRAVIAANSELQERDALKRGGLTAAMTQALQEQGVPDPIADLAAELGVLALSDAFARWADLTNQQGFGELARQSLQQLQAASASLS